MRLFTHTANAVKNYYLCGLVSLLLVLLVVTALLAACTQLQVAPPTAAPTSTITDSQVTEIPMTLKPREISEGGIRGRVMSQSDVETLPDMPLQDVLVLAINADKFDSLLRESELSEVNINRLEGSGLPALPKELFERYAEAFAMSQKGGDYALQLPAGDYFLCLANIGRSEMFPVHILGCIEVNVPDSTWEVRDVLTQFGRVTSR